MSNAYFYLNFHFPSQFSGREWVLSIRKKKILFQKFLKLANTHRDVGFQITYVTKMIAEVIVSLELDKCFLHRKKF